jgi:hypothetical protein
MVSLTHNDDGGCTVFLVYAEMNVECNTWNIKIANVCSNEKSC